MHACHEMVELAGDDDIAQQACELSRIGLHHIRRVIRAIETFDWIAACAKVQRYKTQFLGTGD
jgi:hypothetical protein